MSLYIVIFILEHDLEKLLWSSQLGFCQSFFTTNELFIITNNELFCVTFPINVHSTEYGFPFIIDACLQMHELE